MGELSSTSALSAVSAICAPTLESVDPTLLRAAAELALPGAVGGDVGANLGLFSFASAGLAGASGQVFAIEPDTYLVGCCAVLRA